MTRVTNIGIKRTYVEAGFGDNSEFTKDAPPKDLDVTKISAIDSVVAPPKKKRKRTPKSKRDGNTAKLSSATAGSGAAAEDGIDNEGQPATEDGEPSQPKLSKVAKKNKKNRERKQRVASVSEARRLKRINEKLANTTCFACRKTGHAAKDCTTAVGDQKDASKPGVGICYRCGSKKHSLSKCKKVANPEDPYPFASCFVCNGKGHLASACPENSMKGVYPNGGSCKLCGQTTHLARDCTIRKIAVADPTTLIGTGRETGADEDDFHTLKRHTRDLDREETRTTAIKTKNLSEIKKGSFSGTLVNTSLRAPIVKKKVVTFK